MAGKDLVRSIKFLAEPIPGDSFRYLMTIEVNGELFFTGESILGRTPRQDVTTFIEQCEGPIDKVTFIDRTVQ